MIDLNFFNTSRDVAMATNFVSYRTCSLGTEVSQDPLDRFSQSLHRMVSIEWQMINPTFFRFLKGRCDDNQFNGKNGAKLPTPCTYGSVILHTVRESEEESKRGQNLAMRQITRFSSET